MGVEITTAMLSAAMEEAVKVGLIPKYSFPDQIEKNWKAMEQILEAAWSAREEAP